MHRVFLFFLLLLSTSILSAQSITPYTINNGGGYSGSMEWSIGESVSIANFIASGYSLNTGVLQPMTSIVTAINEYGPVVFGTQITIGPNPTSNLLHIKARFNQVGSLSFQLIDAKSTIVFTQEVGTIFSNYYKDILMENYPSGVFYMKVYFKSITGKTKTGIYCKLVRP
ncbi:MAG: hypothetical protein NT153_08390 [Bacteroidetes bacterium]|nr:hypothetical protein [Bacteroidota bacterium]